MYKAKTLGIQEEIDRITIILDVINIPLSEVGQIDKTLLNILRIYITYKRVI